MVYARQLFAAAVRQDHPAVVSAKEKLLTLAGIPTKNYTQHILDANVPSDKIILLWYQPRKNYSPWRVSLRRIILNTSLMHMMDIMKRMMNQTTTISNNNNNQTRKCVSSLPYFIWDCSMMPWGSWTNVDIACNVHCC
jgi:hypothetical protein